MEKLKIFYLKYKHAVPLIIYAIIYMTWFAWLEKNITGHYRIIHMADDYIPFCEVFVIPYFLWFAYVSAVVIYFFFKNKEDYYRTCIFLFTGMTIFLIVSTLVAQRTAPSSAVMPRDNIFTRMVAALYRTDTPTNLWPSIHVYNSLGAHLRSSAVNASRRKRASHRIPDFGFFDHHGNHVHQTALRLRCAHRFRYGGCDVHPGISLRPADRSQRFRNKRKAKPQIS